MRCSNALRLDPAPKESLSLPEEKLPFSRTRASALTRRVKPVAGWRPGAPELPGKYHSHTRGAGTLRLLPLNSLGLSNAAKFTIIQLNRPLLRSGCVQSPGLRAYFFS